MSSKKVYGIYQSPNYAGKSNENKYSACVLILAVVILAVGVIIFTVYCC